MQQVATAWHCGESVVSLEIPILVGILNATPDSFSDGGAYLEVDAAVKHALEMVEAGATIIDVGGESTRPGAMRVDEEEQIARVVPVIQAIQNACNAIISIDTTRSSVARAAISVGATIINDVSAGIEDPEIFALAASEGVGLVLMHRLLPPELDSYSDQYEVDPTSPNITREVRDWLMERVSIAESCGVDPNSVAIDPGLGFGKSVEQNLELVDNVEQLVMTGYPVYVGASRKSFIGAAVGIDDPSLRDEASAMIAGDMATQGAQIFRVHNVRQHARLLQFTN
jgi:dihydropteroate synthase